MADNAEKDRPKNGRPRKLTGTQVILIAGFAVVIAVIAVAGYFIYQALNKEPAPIIQNTGGNYVIDESNLSDISAKIDQDVQDGMYEVTMNTIWTFKNGNEASSDAYVANAAGNHKPVFIEVTLADTGQLVYTSTVIPVGSALKTIKLNTTLPKGTYDAVCTYSLLGEDNNIDSSFAVNITLDVRN